MIVAGVVASSCGPSSYVTKTTTRTTAGTYTWTNPRPGLITTLVSWNVVGGGGAGNNGDQGGGGGGQVLTGTNRDISTSGNSWSFTVGDGGSTNSADGSSSTLLTSTAAAGKGAPGFSVGGQSGSGNNGGQGVFDIGNPIGGGGGGQGGAGTDASDIIGYRYAGNGGAADANGWGGGGAGGSAKPGVPDGTPIEAATAGTGRGGSGKNIAGASGRVSFTWVGPSFVSDLGT